jgi:hypothetical protein
MLGSSLSMTRSARQIAITRTAGYKAMALA